MSKYLYLVTIRRGRINSDHHIFYRNVIDLNAKSTDYGGINNACVISHHMDKRTIHTLCTEGMKNENEVDVEEITKKSLNDPDGFHKLFKELIDKYYLPYDRYPNVE